MVCASCGGDDNDAVACEIALGDERSTVTFAAEEGESAEASIGDYVFTFVVLPESRVRARVTTGADRFVFESEFGIDGGGGSMPARDQSMSYTCA
jgi:hypothetical protein